MKIQIASPCFESWDEMAGDDRVRHCGRCDRNVYNAENLTERELAKLVHGAEGRICMRLYQREDGTLVTRDCPAVRATLGRINSVRLGAVAMPVDHRPQAPERPLTAIEAVMIGVLMVLPVGFFAWLLN